MVQKLHFISKIIINRNKKINIKKQQLDKLLFNNNKQHFLMDVPLQNKLMVILFLQMNYKNLILNILIHGNNKDLMKILH